LLLLVLLTKFGSSVFEPHLVDSNNNVSFMLGGM